MTAHLFPDELLAALDGTLARERTDHLATCATCRDGVAELRATLGAIQTIDVPEPSPLFWDHLTDRVRLATSAEAGPWSVSRWGRLWRPVAAFGAVAAVVAVVVGLRTPPFATTRDAVAPVTDRAQTAPPSDDGEWDTMRQMASSLSADDVHLVVAAAPEYAPTVSELSAREREAFVRLLGSELNSELR